MLSHMLTESESGPRRGSAVHAAPDSLGRDLAFGATWESPNPGSRLTAPARA